MVRYPHELQDESLEESSTAGKGDRTMTHNRIVTREAWLAARKAHLQKEKELTRLRDQLSAERRELPWVKVDNSYVFEGPNGTETLSDLFDGRSQLIIKHFMLGPGWKEGCVGCSFESTTSRVLSCISHITT